MKRLALLLIILGIANGCQKSLAKADYAIEISIIRDDRVQKIQKTCPYDTLCFVEMKILSYIKYKAADVRVESLRKSKSKEWYFKVDIKTTNALGVESETSRIIYTTEEKLLKDPLVYQSYDLGRIEIKAIP